MRTLLSLAVVCVVASPTVAQELPKLDGTWKVVSTSGHGKTATAEGGKAHDGTPLWSRTTFVIKGDKLVTNEEPVVLPEAKPEVGFYFAINQDERKYKLKAAKGKDNGPKAIDLVVGDGIVLKGIYELKGDELKLCVVNWLAVKGDDDAAKAKAAESKARPADFKTKSGKTGGDYVSFVLKREKR